MTDNYTEEMEYEAYVDMCERLFLPTLSYEEWLNATAPTPLVETSEGP